MTRTCDITSSGSRRFTRSLPVIVRTQPLPSRVIVWPTKVRPARKKIPTLITCSLVNLRRGAIRREHALALLTDVGVVLLHHQLLQRADQLAVDVRAARTLNQKIDSLAPHTGVGIRQQGLREQIAHFLVAREPPQALQS